MDNDRGAAGNGYPDAAQIYRQLIKLNAGMEELKTAVRALRRQTEAEAAGRRAAREGGSGA